MQHAKKLVLLDLKFLEQLQADREYKQIQKPADALAKTSLSLDIGRILRDDTTPEDKKVKLYLDALRRYTNVRSAIPLEADIAPPPTPPPPPPPPPPPQAERGRPRERRPSASPRPIRTRARTKRLGTWVEY